jgi:hypothetical protein
VALFKQLSDQFPVVIHNRIDDCRARLKALGKEHKYPYRARKSRCQQDHGKTK